nr:menaquinone biosynthesis protein [Cavernulicola chilensis]
MRTLKYLILASRPKTLRICLAPFILGTAFAYKISLHIDVLLSVVTLVLFFLMQIFANYCNDYYDYVNGIDTLRRQGPMRVSQAGLINPDNIQNILKLLIFGIIILALIVIFLSRQNKLFISLVILLGTLVAWLYTGGPVPLGYVGLGELSVFVSFGPLAVLTSYYIQLTYLDFNAEVLTTSISCGLISASILVVNNTRDRVSDKIAKKNTISVLYGKSFSQIEYVILMIGGLLISSILLLGNIRKEILAYVLIQLLFKAMKYSASIFEIQSANGYNNLLEKTSELLLQYSILVAICIWFTSLVNLS